MKNNWFQVDVNGLAQLQAGKPKWHIARELVQNAFDEQATEVSVTLIPESRQARIIVEDDSPEGFRSIEDAFTLFGETYKRSDPTKRGRFNLGEKQAIAQASFAKIETTKGTVTFDSDGSRRRSKATRNMGSKVTLSFRCNEMDRQEILDKLKMFVAPETITYRVNGDIVCRPSRDGAFEHCLATVNLDDGMLKETYRTTEVVMYQPNGAGTWLFEMGIPVFKIDCKYSLDVQQKVPLAMDRESVREGYLKDLYAAVLNNTVANLRPSESSETWVRLGAQHYEVKTETTKAILQKRFGDKVAVFTPGDGRANDEAVANGYKVVTGSELSAEEWERVRAAKAMPTTKELFGLNVGHSEYVIPTQAMQRVATLARKIAERMDGYSLDVQFIEMPTSAGVAWFRDPVLTFVVDRLPEGFFDNPIAPAVIDLIIHELGHKHGHHTERAYLDALTRYGGELVSIALNDPEFFTSLINRELKESEVAF